MEIAAILANSLRIARVPKYQIAFVNAATSVRIGTRRLATVQLSPRSDARDASPHSKKPDILALPAATDAE